MRILSVTLGLLFAFAPPVFAEQRLLVVADEWPPFSGRDLPNQGISVDVITAVLTRAGYDVTADILPWARIMDGSRQGDYDIVGSLFFDAEIAEYMTYADPFYQTQVKFVAQTGEDVSIGQYSDIAEYSVAVGDGFLYEERFDRDEALNKVVVTTTTQAMNMVAYGRVDVTLDSQEVLAHVTNVVAPDLKDRLIALPFVLAEHAVHMAVRTDLENSAEIVADFNRVLAEMKKDGSLDALLIKHDPNRG